MAGRRREAPEAFERVFYTPPRTRSGDADEHREELQIRVHEDPTGSCPPPIERFEELGVLPEYVINNLQYQGIEKPMPIQAQALPLVLGGNDVIGLAQTGSGKTLAFLLPAVPHMEAQRPVDTRNPTPIVLVLAPTRELAVQISEEADKVLWDSKLGNHSRGLHAACLYGGGNKRDQVAKLKQGGQVVVATPGRLIDFIDSATVSLQRVTYFVLDEADRMLDMGFQGDVDAISSHIRPDRQVLFFSATWSQDVQWLASGLCDPNGDGPVRISCGQANQESQAKQRAREGIEQRVIVCDSGGDWQQQAAQKRMILERHITSALEESEDHKVLVFVSQKNFADELANALYSDGFAADAMHGGKTQEGRLWVLDQFRKGLLRLLVCTDVLGRGIDLPDVSHVVVFEMGAIDDYIHRIGRTGRGLNGKGHALVFFEYWEKMPEVAGELVEVLRASSQPVPEDLRRIAAEVASGRRGGRGAGTWSGGGYSGNKSASQAWSGGGYSGNSWPAAAPAPAKAAAATPAAATPAAGGAKTNAPVAKAPPPRDVPDTWDDDSEDEAKQDEVPDSWED